TQPVSMPIALVLLCQTGARADAPCAAHQAVQNVVFERGRLIAASTLLIRISLFGQHATLAPNQIIVCVVGEAALRAHRAGRLSQGVVTIKGAAARRLGRGGARRRLRTDLPADSR